jgi:hypothetical protein
VALSSTPPVLWDRVFKKGHTGWSVYGLQCCLNSIRWAEDRTWPHLMPDGVFGGDTEAVLMVAQARLRITADGVCGPTTQRTLLGWAGDRIHAVLPEVPLGLMKGYVESEGANLLAATNWAVAGGVDCGPTQLRCVGPPCKMEHLQLAFNPVRALQDSGNMFLLRCETLVSGTAAKKNGEEFLKRCAAMAHNWPTQGGADYIAEHGKCSYPESPCTWVPRNPDTGKSLVKFPDQVPVETRWEWCQFYAMGAPEHGNWKGAVTKYVTDWH